MIPSRSGRTASCWATRIIDVNPRRSVEMQEALRREKKARRTPSLLSRRADVERSGSERVNGRLKDEFGGRHVRVRGYDKVLAHLMFGMTPAMTCWVSRNAYELLDRDTSDTGRRAACQGGAHLFRASRSARPVGCRANAWMAGTSPAMTCWVSRNAYELLDRDTSDTGRRAACQGGAHGYARGVGAMRVREYGWARLGVAGQSEGHGKARLGLAWRGTARRGRAGNRPITGKAKCCISATAGGEFASCADLLLRRPRSDCQGTSSGFGWSDAMIPWEGTRNA